MNETTIKLTEEELDRIITVMCCNLDMNIQAKLDRAMERKHESEATRLMEVKASDQALVAKLQRAR